jgi:hypothetical protein
MVTFKFRCHDFTSEMLPDLDGVGFDYSVQREGNLEVLNIEIKDDFVSLSLIPLPEADSNRLVTLLEGFL